MNLVSVQEYADKLGITRQALHSRRVRGSIEFEMVEGHLFVDLDKYPVTRLKPGRPSSADVLRRQKTHPKK